METWTSIFPQHVGLVIYGITIFALALLSSFGYFTFLRVTWGKKSLQMNSIPLMSLCVSDLGVVFGHMVGQVIVSFSPVVPWEDFGRKVNAFCGMAFMCVSIGNIAFIAYDTYLKETKSCLHRLNYGFYITAIWIVGLLTGFLGVGSYGLESELQVGCLIDYTTTNSGSIRFISICVVVWFIIPMYIITNYYSKLKRETGNGMRLKIVTGQMLICWTPYAVISFVTMSLGTVNVTLAALSIASNVLVKICVATNPYIYMLTGGVNMRVACNDVLFGSSKKAKLQISYDEELENSKDK